MKPRVYCVFFFKRFILFSLYPSLFLSCLFSSVSIFGFSPHFTFFFICFQYFFYCAGDTVHDEAGVVAEGCRRAQGFRRDGTPQQAYRQFQRLDRSGGSWRGGRCFQVQYSTANSYRTNIIFLLININSNSIKYYCSTAGRPGSSEVTM